MSKGKTNVGGGSDLSKIIVTAETGSTVYLADANDNRRDTTEKNGVWTFYNVPVGEWTAYATKNDKWTSEDVNIETDKQCFVYNVELSYFNATIDVTYPEGSTCTCTLGDRVLTAEDTSGRYVFRIKFSGEWTVHCSDGTSSAEKAVNVTTDGQTEIISLSYQLYASDFDFSGLGTLGVDYQIVYDDDIDIPQKLWSTTKKWKCRSLVSGSAKALKDGYIDVFCLGGGGAGGTANGGYGSGGAGGYTNTGRMIYLHANNTYPIVIGAGGVATTTKGNPGSETSAFSVKAAGGNGGLYTSTTGGHTDGVNGGSGSGWGDNPDGGAGANDGNDASDKSKEATGGKGQRSVPGPNGETGSTREFGEDSGKLYSGGGGGSGNESGGTGGDGGGGAGGSSPISGTANTGGGGGGTHGKRTAGNGGSGIVVFRNAREVT